MQTPTQPPRPAHDPTKVSKSLAIALVVSAVFLLAAVGIAAWLLLRGGGSVANTVQDPDAATKNVKNVSLVEPKDLASYKKNDQSPLGATHTYYYNDTTNCGFTQIVAPLATNKSAQDTLLGVVEAAQAQGAKVTADKLADKVDLRDTGQDTTYSFESLAIQRSVNVPGVAYSGFDGIALYKQLGQKLAAVVYGCPDSIWPAHKDDMAALAALFTVTTER